MFCCPFFAPSPVNGIIIKREKLVEQAFNLRKKNLKEGKYADMVRRSKYSEPSKMGRKEKKARFLLVCRRGMKSFSPGRRRRRFRPQQHDRKQEE